MKRLNEEVQFNAPSRFNVLPAKPVGRLSGTTPSVLNCETFVCNGIVVTVANFLGGSSGQHLTILGDGSTTIAHNTNIKTNTSANKLLAADKIYHFTLIDDVWYEDA